MFEPSIIAHSELIKFQYKLPTGNLNVMNGRKVTGPRTQYVRAKVHPDPQNVDGKKTRVSIAAKDFEDGDSEEELAFPTIGGDDNDTVVSKKRSPSNRNRMPSIPRQLSGSVRPRFLSRKKPAWTMVPRRDSETARKSKIHVESMLKFRRALLKIAHTRAGTEKPKYSMKKLILRFFTKSESSPGEHHPRRLSQRTQPQSIRNLMQLLEKHQTKMNSLVRTETPLRWKAISRGSAQEILDKKDIVTEETSEFDSKSRCVIGHYSIFRAAWDCFMTVFIILLVFWVPLQVAFCFPDAQHIEAMAGCPHFSTDLGLCIFIQLVLIVDLVLNFITSSVNLKGEEITSNAEIALYYMCNQRRHFLNAHFLCDVISAIPFMLVFAAEGYTNWARVLRLLVMTKVYKLRVLLIHLEDRLQLNIVNAEFINLAMWFCIVSHIMSCLFYLSADVRNALTGDSHNSWISHSGMYENAASWVDKYVISLYWFSATLFTVGYGDVVAHSTAERIYAVVAMIMGCVVYSFIIGTVTQLLMRVGTHEELFHNKMREIDAFLQAREVPVALQVVVMVVVGASDGDGDGDDNGDGDGASDGDGDGDGASDGDGDDGDGAGSTRAWE